MVAVGALASPSLGPFRRESPRLGSAPFGRGASVWASVVTDTTSWVGIGVCLHPKLGEGRAPTAPASFGRQHCHCDRIH
jgi:hypothetical protein